MGLYSIRRQLTGGKTIFDLPLRVTVSTDKDEQLHSLCAQVRYYSDFTQQNPNWGFVEGYVDEGLSATSVTKRDSFLRMIDDAKLGKFDFVITKEISRFSRNTLDSIQYTQELLRQVVVDKAKIIHDLIRLYTTILTSTDLETDIAKCQTEINSILQKKDKLLDLSIKGRLSDEEFEQRNNRFNREIEALQSRIDDYKLQESQNGDVAKTVEALRKAISGELDFDGGVDANVLDALLDRIEVYEGESKNEVRLKIYLKVMEDSQQYGIVRRRGKTSVCTALYVLCGTNNIGCGRKTQTRNNPKRFS